MVRLSYVSLVPLPVGGLDGGSRGQSPQVIREKNHLATLQQFWAVLAVFRFISDPVISTVILSSHKFIKIKSLYVSNFLNSNKYRDVSAKVQKRCEVKKLTPELESVAIGTQVLPQSVTDLLRSESEMARKRSITAEADETIA